MTNRVATPKKPRIEIAPRLFEGFAIMFKKSQMSDRLPRKHGRNRNSILRDLTLTVAASFAALCVLELSLHLCRVHLNASLYQKDPVRNYSFRPNASGWVTSEKDVLVHINNFGNRDRDRSLTPAPHTLRIAVLGSSTTAGLEVAQKQTYTAIMERLLSRSGAPVEVLNFAVPGYGPAQDYYTLHDEVWEFHPQIVMEEVSLKQYVLNSVRKLSQNGSSYPYYKLDAGALVPDDGTPISDRPNKRQISLSNHIRGIVNSIDLILLAHSFKKRLGWFTSKSFVPYLEGSQPFVEDTRSDPWRWTLLPPSSPEVEQGWEILQRLLVLMRDETITQGAEFWVIETDDAFQVNPDPKVSERLRIRMKSPDLTYGDRRFDNFLSGQGIQHVHLAPPLLAYALRTGTYLHGGPKIAPGDGHWNVLGHRVVGEVVSQELRRDSVMLQRWEATTTFASISPSQQALPSKGPY